MSSMKNKEYALSVIDSELPPGFRVIPSFKSYAINNDGTVFLRLVRWFDKCAPRGDNPSKHKPLGDDFRQHFAVHGLESGPRELRPNDTGHGYMQYNVTLCPLDDGYARCDTRGLMQWVADEYPEDADTGWWRHRGEYRDKRRKATRGNERRRLVHRLVFEAWSREGLNPALQIDHIDGNNQNNHIENLRQVTSFENIHNPVTAARRLEALSKLTESQVHDIRDQWDSRPKTLKLKDLKAQLATHYGVSQANIEAIGYRKSWRHLPEKDGSPMRTPQKRIKKGEAQ